LIFAQHTYLKGLPHGVAAGRRFRMLGRCALFGEGQAIGIPQQPSAVDWANSKKSDRSSKGCDSSEDSPTIAIFGRKLPLSIGARK
jgi:hypothetical protein